MNLLEIATTRARRAGSLALGLALLAAAAGCGGSDSTSGSGTEPFAPADHTPLPQLRNHGGVVFDHIELVTITFPNYDHKDLVEGFGDWIVTSDYYTQMGAEYGVLAGTHLAKVALPDDPPTSDGALIQLIKDRMADGTLPNSAEHPQALYAAYFPEHAKFGGGGDPLCGSSLAYHSFFGPNDAQVAYSVIGDCGANPNYGAVSNASHEIIEVATDPFNAWYVDPAKTDPWHFVYDDELADMCEYFPVVYDNDYPLARWWSNKAAAANENPCLPLPTDFPVYRVVSASPATMVSLKAGASTTFTLTGWSSGPTNAWKLFAEAEPGYSSFEFYRNAIKVSLDKDVMNNGDTVHLTVTMPQGIPPGKEAIAGVYADNFGEAWYVGVISE